MTMKKFPYSDGIVSRSKEAHGQNPQPFLNSNMYLVSSSGHVNGHVNLNCSFLRVFVWGVNSESILV